MKTRPTGAVVTGISRAHSVHLDGLRGLAILLVMIYHFSLPHAGFHGHDSGVLLQLAQAGWMGVDLFFVLSGFLITGILVGTRAQKHYFRNFLARRFLRIWPLYYLILLVFLVVLPLVLPTVPNELQGMRDKQIWFWLYGANWLFAVEGGFSQTSGGYFWSLAVEEQFYLIWPFVVYSLSDRMLLRISLALLCVSLISRIVLVNMGISTSALYAMTFTHLDGLAVGSCLAICLRSPELALRVTRLLRGAAVIAFCGLLAVRFVDEDFFFWSKNMATYGYTLIVILFGSMLVFAMRGERSGGLSRVLSSRFMTLCGRYSYALYMVHVPVAGLLLPLTFRALEKFRPVIGYEGTFLTFAVASFVVSWSLAVASWYLFEKHVLALKRYFTYSEADTAQKLAAAPR
jgi:peptidoglycan/LPS O-acetylase OafA/YrhL